MQTLKARIIEAARVAGAGDIGVADHARLADGPPSADPTYILDEARTVVSFWVALDDAKIGPFIAKEEREGFRHHLGETYRRCWQVGEAICEVLRTSGYAAINVWPNASYRPSSNPFELAPDFSHRCGAVASGIGQFGRSGNVLVPSHGARVLLSSVISSAPLPPDPMMEERLCDDCKLCTAVCQVGMMSSSETEVLRLGGRDHAIARKASNARCGICCGGWLGQHNYLHWSTWSPERLAIPDDDRQLETFFITQVGEWHQTGDPMDRYMAQILEDRELGAHGKPLDHFDDTCGFCQLVCAATREDRKRDYKTIVNSGVVVRNSNGELVVIRNAPHEQNGTRDRLSNGQEGL